MRLFVLYATLALIASSTIARADAPAKPVTRDYDIRKLVVYIPDFTDAPDFSLKPLEDSATTRPAPKQPTRDEIVNGIVDAVRQLLPASPDVDIVEDKGTLHVTALPDDQARVASAIARWIDARSIEITIETREFSINHKDMAGLNPAARALFDAIGPDNVPVTIDDHQTNLVIRSALDTKDSVLVTAPRVTLFQNQRAYVLIADQQAYVSGYRRDTSVAGKPVDKPIVSVAEHGFVFDVRANAVSAGNASAISVDMHDRFASLHGMHNSTWTDPITGEKLPIQIPDLSRQSVDCLLTILPHHSALMRFPDSSAFGTFSRPAVGPGHDCFILVTASIVKPATTQPAPH